MTRNYKKYADRRFTRMFLLEYLTKNDDAALTRAMFVMEKNMRDSREIVRSMEEEGLITVQWSNSEWQRARIRITSKGLGVYQILKEMYVMLLPKINI